MAKKKEKLTAALIDEYMTYLCEQERSLATLQKYRRDLSALSKYLDGRALDKTVLIEWKRQLTDSYAPATVNSMIAALNGFLSFIDRQELSVKPLKIQKSLFLDERRELTRSEYARLVKTAQSRENERLSLIIQTICSTGIRVSELEFITVEAAERGRAEVSNKGKRRTVFLSDRLCSLLKDYCHKQKKTAGAVFTTRSGKAIDRSNIWRDMKVLCDGAGVEQEKVFPHNLRHLFARTYYTQEKDLSRLADILGHSNISTTRIYTAESGTVHARQMERVGLIIT